MNRWSSSWIVGSAAVCFSGWALSIIQQLNVIGYAIAIVVTAIVIVLHWRCQSLAPIGIRRRISKILIRFRRPLPFCFLLIAALAGLGGCLYSPNNFDAMTYRLPRVLHWLAQQQWHWIHTPDPRMNNRACDFEWLTAPLLTLTHSDRLFFLVNTISFFLLPGLIFSVFSRLGVRSRTAWNWMWIVPAGLNFVLQAGSIANDLFSAVYVLAAVGFALRARRTNRFADVAVSVLAAALVIGAKASNLPLLLPWIIAVGPAWRSFSRSPAMAIVVAFVALVVSLFPIAAENIQHSGDWSGANLENPRYQIKSPFIGVIGNAADLFVENCSPPLGSLPGLNETRLRTFVPGVFLHAYDRNFANPFAAHWGGVPIETEDGAGLGIGVTGLIICATLFAAASRRFSLTLRAGPCVALPALIAISSYLALLAFMSKAGMGQPARLITPYYPLLIFPLLTLRGHDRVVRNRLWKGCALLVMMLAVFSVVIAPARPLFPAGLVFAQMHRRGIENAILHRAEVSYAANARRSDGLAELRPLFPAAADVIGLVSNGNDLETSLWKPYGSRRVEYVLPGDTRLPEWMVISGEVIHLRGTTLRDWLTSNSARQIAARTIMRSFPPYAASDWYVARSR